MSGLVFITGGSSGIGQALAVRYAQAGWRVVLVARRLLALQDWARAQGLGPDRCGVYAADVRDDAQLRLAAQACLTDWGVPDVVIANAGISVGIDLDYAEDLAVLRDLIDTNVIGLAATFQPFIGPMKRRGVAQAPWWAWPVWRRCGACPVMPDTALPKVRSCSCAKPCVAS